MFGTGELVVYGRSGICEVMDVTTIQMDGIPLDRLYYVLRPYKEKEGRIFAPVENQKTVMRKLITEKEARELIDLIPEMKELGITNDRLRENVYKECISSCQCEEWVRMIKTLYLRGKKRAEQGKKITGTDEKYMKMAESSLYAELSLALGIPEKGMSQYIGERVEILRQNAS